MDSAPNFCVTGLQKKPGGADEIAAKTLPAYLPQVDGLRAFAIIGVLLFHLEIKGMNLGWSGVWLFFVISGFLITGILLDSKTRPSYFKNFYIRRALRIFPIYFACLSVVTVVALFKGSPINDFFYYLCYIQNHVLGRTQFHPQFPEAFNHTWTLAVEEQFYFVWPLLVWCLKKSALTVVCVMLVIGAPVSRVIILHATETSYLAMTPLVVNVDALALGALIAIGLRTGGMGNDVLQRIRNCAGAKGGCYALLGLTAGLTAWLVLSHGVSTYWTPTRWLGRVDGNILLSTILSLGFAALLFYVVVWDGWLRRILSNGALVHIGKISYGLYIFHGLVFVCLPFVFRGLNIGTWTQNGWVLAACKLGCTYAIALLSWNFFESRFLRLKTKFV